MAGNKINSKSKGNQYKATKNTHNDNDVNEDLDLDFSQLRMPIQTSITGLGKVIKVFDTATEELKGMLSRECDIIYECKVCRSMYRSLPNFVSHKRMFCTEKFNCFKHSHFVKDNVAFDIKKITTIENGYQESLTMERNDVENGNEDRIPLTKDLTAVVEATTKSKGINNDSECEMISQKIPDTAVAAYQSVNYDTDEKLENMHKQVEELNNILSMDKVVLKSGGKFKIQRSVDEMDTATDNVIQISDDDDDLNMLKCKICDMQFSTQKTFRFHMKCKHVETRLVYPCPDCMEIFSTSWSVFRHLFKVHRKTAAQVRRLRESIQSKAFKINNPPAFYEKRKNMNLKVAALKKSSQGKLEQENQEWIDSMEGDSGVPRCGGCGRHFERRAALAAHLNTCQPRARAINRRPDAKRIEIQIRKDYNKGPAASFRLLSKPPDATDKTPVEDSEKDESQETTVGNKESEQIENMPPQNNVEKTTEPTYLHEAKMDVIESDGKETLVVENETKSNRTFSLSFTQLSRSNMTAFKQKVEADIENLLCRRCDEEFCDTDKLYEHVAGHYGWMRYACKLCNFKHYLIDKLIEHVKVVHKLKGDLDLYGSTIKALDGPEALELLVEQNEINDSNKTSPDSRRPSRCSSDSSRLSDDSCSSNTRVETVNKKRKIYPNKNIRIKKKKREERKEIVLAGDGEKDNNFDMALDALLTDNDSSNSKTWEENSSDKDDVEEKATNDQNKKPYGATSRRPVRNKSKPRNKDFEYDLSNLLKSDAQAYKDFQFTTTAKTNANKRKPQSDNQIINNPVIITNSIKDYSGALIALSKKATDIAAAHMKVQTYALYNKRKEQINQFIKPPLPKISRNEKMSPNKGAIEDVSKCTTPEKSRENKKINGTDNDINSNHSKEIGKVENTVVIKEIACNDNDEQKKPSGTVKNNPLPLPIKFSRESLEIIRNPLINQKFNEFSKAGKQTKILVIKPINRNKDSNVNNPLKFQTIKIKDPRRLSNEDRSSEQIVVLKFPKTDSKVAQQTEKCNSNKDKPTDVCNQVVDIDCNSKTDEANKNNTNVTNSEKIKDKSTNDCKENKSVVTADVVDSTNIDLKCSETL